MDNLQSEQINELAKDLAKAQGEMDHADLNKVNPHFKSRYASYESLRDATCAALSKHNIALTHLLSVHDGKRVMVTQLSHSSGQWMRSFVSLSQEKETPQGIGSAITYAKRYSLGALLGIGSEEDDDGEEAEKPYRNGKEAQKPAEEKLNRNQIQSIVDECKGDIALMESIVKAYKCDRMEDIKSSAYPFIIKNIKTKKEQVEHARTGT